MWPIFIFILAIIISHRHFLMSLYWTILPKTCTQPVLLEDPFCNAESHYKNYNQHFSELLNSENEQWKVVRPMNWINFNPLVIGSTPG